MHPSKLQLKALLIILSVLLVLLITILVSIFVSKKPAESKFWPLHDSQSRLGKYQQAAVSSGATPCAHVGKDILRRNGSAVDAAIATLVCMGVNLPDSMGLGGGFLMVYFKKSENKVYYIDSREVAPENASKDMFEGNKTMAYIGGLSIAVPGELAGYEEMHRKFGRLPWKDLFTPSIKMCHEGIIVSDQLAKSLKILRDTTDDDVQKYIHIRNTFLKNGTDLYSKGERIKLPVLARTLEAISEQGKKAIYGPSKMADDFLEDLKAAGSIINGNDMSGYTPLMREPVKMQLRDDITFYSVSMPGSGALLGFMLSVLGGYPELDSSMPKDHRKATLTFHRMVETFKFAYGLRSLLEDENTPEIRQLLANITSRRYSNYIRSQISDIRTYNESEHYSFESDFVEDHGTAHLSIVAPNGDAVSVTSTINYWFGSMVISPSTGIILNNDMDDFSSPNITNIFGVKPTDRNDIRPGKRPFSSMCPSIFVDAQRNVKLVVGGSGGTLIPTAVLQVAMRTLFLGENIKQSIDAPRLHHQLLPDFIRFEHNFPRRLLEFLFKFGHVAKVFDKKMYSYIIGIAKDEDGILYANSDYRRGGDVSGF